MALRTPLSVTPHLYMGDSTGRPLDKGVVYFGEQDKDPEFYPINLFSDDALTLPLAQPVHTKGGYLYDKGDMVEPHAKELIYSVKVLDSYGRKVFYKGAMMRNSWNDDVIEQINAAIVASTDIARQVATDIANEAINNTAVEGGVLADTFVVVDGTLSQRTINKGLESIADLSTINNPKDGLRVYVKSFHEGLGYGGGTFVWNPTMDKGLADGGVYIDPTSLGGYSGKYPDVLAYLKAQGTGTGVGVWERTIKKDMTDPLDYGAVINTRATKNKLHEIISHCLKLGNRSVQLGAGTWFIDSAILLPSDCILQGTSNKNTFIKASNFFTLGKRNHLIAPEFWQDNVEHTNYVRNIHLRDFTVDMRVDERGHTHNSRASNIYLTVVEDVLVENVISKNANLHCFDVSSSTYSNYVGESKNVRFVNCTAINPQKDDGFTTHYSSKVLFNNCIAILEGWDRDVSGQHGFEIDDGSYDCQVVNCYAEGFSTGYQAKSHGYIGSPHFAARNILFSNCTAHKCYWGFNVQGYSGALLPSGASSSYGVAVLNCTVSDLFPFPNKSQRIVRIEDFCNVVVDGLLVRNFGTGYISLELPNNFDNVTIKNVVFETASTRPPKDTAWGEGALIYREQTGDTKGTLTIEGITSLVPQPVPIVYVAQASLKGMVSISNIRADGSNSNTSMVLVGNTGFPRGVKIENVHGTGWLSPFSSIATEHADRVLIDTSVVDYFYCNGIYITLYIGSTESPLGTVGAYANTRCVNSLGDTYVKRVGSSTLSKSGWEKVALMMDIPEIPDP